MEYGFPPRPSDLASLAQWQAEFSNYAGAAPPPPFVAQTNVAADQTAMDWAGYRVDGNAGEFTHAESTYWEPTKTYQTTCTNRNATFWAGISGGNEIGQDGTYLGNGIPGINSHQAWTEIYSVENITPWPFYASPSDRFDASVEWINGSYSYQFFMYNYNTNKSFSFNDPAPLGTYVGSYAEVVAEHVFGYGDLTNFGTTTNPLTFQRAKANGTGLDSYSSRDQYYIHDSSGGDMADASFLGAYGYFQDTVHHCAY